MKGEFDASKKKKRLTNKEKKRFKEHQEKLVSFQCCMCRQLFPISSDLPNGAFWLPFVIRKLPRIGRPVVTLHWTQMADVSDGRRPFRAGLRW